METFAIDKTALENGPFQCYLAKCQHTMTGEDTDFPPDRSEVFPITSESDVLGTTEHVHYEEGHVHPKPILGHGTDIQPSTPQSAKSVEASS